MGNYASDALPLGECIYRWSSQTGSQSRVRAGLLIDDLLAGFCLSSFFIDFLDIVA